MSGVHHYGNVNTVKDCQVLVNNAGLVGGWDLKVWDVLANGVVKGTDLALARMKHGGIVVQVRFT